MAITREAPIKLRLGDVHDADRPDTDHGNSVAVAEAARPRHLGGQVEAVGDGEQLGQHGHARSASSRAP